MYIVTSQWTTCNYIHFLLYHSYIHTDIPTAWQNALYKPTVDAPQLKVYSQL